MPRAGDHAGAGQGQMLPRPGLAHLVVAKRLQRRRHRPLPPRGAQAHVHLEQPPRGGRRRHRGEKRLRQPRVIGPRGERPRTVGCVDPVRVVDHDQVEVRLRVEVPRAERAHSQHDRPPTRRRPVADREVARDHARQRANRGVGDVGVLHRRLVRADQPAQVMDADAELPFVRPAARGVQRDLVAPGRLRQGRLQLCVERLAQPRGPRPGCEEVPGQYPVQHLGVAGEVGREARHRSADVGQKVDQLRVRPEQREQLHPRRQAAQEAVEPHQRLGRMRRAAHAGQDLRLDPGKDLLRAARFQRRIGTPAFDHRRRFGRHRRHRRIVGTARFGVEEVAREFLDPGEPAFQIGGPRPRVVRSVQRRDLRKRVLHLRQRVGLAVVHHLDAVLDAPVGAVVIRQLVRDRLRDPSLCRQRGERRDGGAAPQVRVAAAGDQLAGLREELDVADPALPQLHVVPHRADRPMQPLVAADPPPHVVGVLDRREVERAAPDEGPQLGQEALARGEVARAGPRLDVGRAFPAAPLGLVIGKRGAGRDADGRHRRVGAQPQVGAEDVAVLGQVGQCRGRLAGGADQGGAHLGLVAGRVGRVVVEHDQVDVRGIVQLARAHLAHREHEQARRIWRAVGARRGQGRGQFAAPDLVRDMGAEGEVGRPVREVGQPLRHLLDRPDAAEIGERDPQRDPALGPAQGGPQFSGGQCIHPRRLVRDHVAEAERGWQPVRLAVDQRGEVGA